MLLAGSSFGCSSSTSESPPHSSSATVPSQVNEDVEGKAEVSQLSHIRTNPPLSAALSDELSNLDPANAGWDSEAFHDAQSKRFKKLGHLLFDAPNPRADALAELLSDNFTCSGLRPEQLIEAFSDRAIVVRRASKDEIASIHVRGVSGLLAAAAPLRQLLVDSDERRVKFKTLGVDLTDDSAGTTTVFQASGHSPEEAVQINATWECTWTREDLPRLVSIDVKDYEEIVPRSTGRVHFGDATEAVLGRNKSFREQLAFGYDHWRSRSSRSLQFDLAGNQGLALGDVNGDGLDDIYMAQSGGLPNRLFLHNSDGTATDISKQAGVDWLDFSRTALLIDLDNDGDQDMALGLSAGVLFLENDGQAHFQLKNAVRCRGSVYALAAADYDNDGDLDVYACGRYANDADDNETRVSGLPLPYHDANNGGPGTLLRNDIGSSGVAPWQFRDVTIEVGLEVNNRRFTLAAAWEDYDNDGDQDLYLVISVEIISIAMTVGSLSTWHAVLVSRTSAQGCRPVGAMRMATDWLISTSAICSLQQDIVSPHKASSWPMLMKRLEPNTVDTHVATHSLSIGVTVRSTMQQRKLESISAVGLGVRCSWTSMAMDVTTWWLRTALSRLKIQETCEVSIGDRSCRNHHKTVATEALCRNIRKLGQPLIRYSKRGVRLVVTNGIACF